MNGDAGNAADMSSRPSGGRRTGRLALAVATIALLVAVGAAFVSAQAYLGSRDARSIAMGVRSAGGSAATPSVPQTATPPSNTSPFAETTPSTSAPIESGGDSTADATPGGDDGVEGDGEFTIPAAGTYDVVYESSPLTLNPGDGTCTKRAVDLDQPRVGEDRGGDVTYAVDCRTGEPPSLEFKDARVTELRAQELAPEDCARSIGSSPVATTQVPSEGLVLCAVTDGVGSPNQPQRRKVAILTVEAVQDSGTVSLVVSAWAIPR